MSRCSLKEISRRYRKLSQILFRLSAKFSEISGKLKYFPDHFEKTKFVRTNLINLNGENI